MSIDKILVTISGLGLSIFIYYFFLMRKGKEVKAVSSIDITVEGGYNPEIIQVPVGKETTLNFIRKDSNSCLEEVVLSDFGIRKFLTLDKKVEIKVNPQKAGEYPF